MHRHIGLDRQPVHMGRPSRQHFPTAVVGHDDERRRIARLHAPEHGRVTFTQTSGAGMGGIDQPGLRQFRHGRRAARRADFTGARIAFGRQRRELGAKADALFLAGWRLVVRAVERERGAAGGDQGDVLALFQLQRFGIVEHAAGLERDAARFHDHELACLRRQYSQHQR